MELNENTILLLNSNVIPLSCFYTLRCERIFLPKIQYVVFKLNKIKNLAILLNKSKIKLN
ncbi:hypothetical protein GCM10009111_26710 [Colwellia asteriadis]|uniref:Uncharacterized protein n=1 Tax=Colwellia asteriadis TaxID=517723 RepID=A0ABP3WIZ0_9GAMM